MIEVYLTYNKKTFLCFIFISEHTGQDLPLEEPGKEPFGPACRDYFWVLCKLVESLKMTEDTVDLVDIECLAMRLYQGITARPFYEKRQGGNSGSPDDALVGMLNLMSAVLKHNPDFKQQPVGQELVEKLFMVRKCSDRSEIF